ncbi:N-acetylmuramoyl-L-alanine amidase family protein [Clostridium sp. AF32-12BH]|uniref:N-acetylmuramoyl-L-alanine amidase family protein n=1 Tax=Clostridium sp. AF32-12BH TaxID=2292006 RepID=UPI0015FC5462|nr:N-acetylmuramoyl-L-alanine amidase family protein [Clostridium sp. AF32-12BH]
MAFYDPQKLVNFLKKYNGYVEKRKNTPKKNLYEMTGNYVGSDNWTMFWQDLADAGLANYQGSYYCIATIFWGFVKVYGLAVAQELCLQKFMINCQETYSLFKRKGQVYDSPKFGDIIVFWNGSRFHHAELVTKVTASTFQTFGANTTTNVTTIARNGGGCVCPKTYSISAAKKAGHKFLRPNYGTDKSGWEHNATGWKYRNSDGSYVIDAWKYINDRWYVFGKDSYMITGWYQDKNGQWYYLHNPNGDMVSGDWVYHFDGWYYLDKGGAMHTGWLQIDDSWYYLEQSGKAVKGLHEIGGQLYYFLDDSNKMVCNAWYKYEGEWMYFSSTGAAYRSKWVQQDDGKFYYLADNGRMANNCWVKSVCSNMYYWLNENGEYIEEKDSENPEGKVVI